MNINNNNNIGDIKRLEELKSQSSIRKSEVDVQQEVLNSVFDAANTIKVNDVNEEILADKERELSPFRKAIANLISFFTGNNANKVGEVDGATPTNGPQSSEEWIDELTKRAENNVPYYDSSQIISYGNYSKIETNGTTIFSRDDAVSAKEDGKDVGGVQKIGGKNGQEFFVLTNEDGTKGVFDPKSGEFLPENKAKEMGLI